MTICPRCKREVNAWPLKRADTCAPKGWVYCIRDYPKGAAAEAAREMRSELARFDTLTSR